MTELNVGMIGLDTSHCPAFTKLLNKKKVKVGSTTAKVKYAYKGGSINFSKSYDRVDKFAHTLKTKFGVQLLDSIEAVVEKSDALIINSCDGRQHYDQYQKIAPFGKPVFIDKPFSCNTTDAKKMIELSNKFGSPIYSASSLRYYRGVEGLINPSQVKFIEAHGPVELLNDYPGYFWYGVHLVEMVYSYMGCGCLGLEVHPSQNVDMIYAKWKEGRTVALYGTRMTKTKEWGMNLYTDQELIKAVAKNRPSGYELMLPHILKFFKTRLSPISQSEMIEIVAFLEAIEYSRKERTFITLDI